MEKQAESYLYLIAILLDMILIIQGVNIYLLR